MSGRHRVSALAAVLAAFAVCAFTPPSAPVLTPAAQKVVDAWRDKYRSAVDRIAKLPPPAGPREDLGRRVEVEQAGREALPQPDGLGLSAEEWRAANAVIWSELGAADADNTAFLKSIMPTDGWFTISQYGEPFIRGAWLIVQHSPDLAFQRRVLQLMEPLVVRKEAYGDDYALLYDRVAVDEGRAQTYGSQAYCSKGKWVLRPIADEAHVDARRREVGLGPLVDYEKLLGVGNAC